MLFHLVILYCPLLIFSLFASIQGVPTNDEGVKEYEQSINSQKNGNRFHFDISTNKLMWKDASLACKKKGMILACLDTIEKHKQFLAALERHFIGDSSHLTLPASYWIGGFRDLDDFAKYQWENGNIVSSYGWLMGETRSPYTYCLKFDPYIPGWHDASCDDLYNYVCMYGDLEEGTKNTEHINKDTDRREIHLEENKNVELRESITEVPKSLTLWRLHNHHRYRIWRPSFPSHDYMYDALPEL